LLYDIISNYPAFFTLNEYSQADLILYYKIKNQINITNEDINNSSYYSSNNFVDDLFDTLGYKNINDAPGTLNNSYNPPFIKSFRWHPYNSSDIERGSIIFNDAYVC